MKKEISARIETTRLEELEKLFNLFEGIHPQRKAVPVPMITQTLLAGKILFSPEKGSSLFSCGNGSLFCLGESREWWKRSEGAKVLTTKPEVLGTLTVSPTEIGTREIITLTWAAGGLSSPWLAVVIAKRGGDLRIFRSLNLNRLISLDLSTKPSPVEGVLSSLKSERGYPLIENWQQIRNDNYYSKMADFLVTTGSVKELLGQIRK